MASLFPGMDPFLEDPAYWADFHYRFVNYWCEAIGDVLPEHYEATLGERVYLIETDPEVRKLGSPDLAVTRPKKSLSRSRFSSSAVATLEPVTIPLTILDGPREAYIEILHHPDRSLVAALELLSPANKERPGRTQYLEKRRALCHQKAHLVELDLLVGGRRVPMDKPLPAGDYYYIISRMEKRPDCDVYSWNLKDPLPTLPVPLRAPDADVHVDLAAVFATTYERGKFGRRIQYDRPIPAPLRKKHKKWVASILRKKGSAS